MNIYSFFREEIIKAVMSLEHNGGELSFERVTAEPPRDPSHGDIATNAAMVLSKYFSMPPRGFAEKIKEQLEKLEAVDAVEIAGPGFINIRVSKRFWQNALKDVLVNGENYGQSTMGNRESINVEYVSTNPTGPLHIGHCRVAVFGDALASLLMHAGYDVVKEYYVNDAGAQAFEVARSVYGRYLQALGRDAPFDLPYGGDYLTPAGKKMAQQDRDQWVGKPEAEWLEYFRSFAIAEMMDMIREDLKVLGIEHDVFTSELELVKTGKVDEALAHLEKRGLIYDGVLEPPKGKKDDDWEAREQKLFRATEFGDDVDRPLQKSDGSWTYFASDIAYHYDKYSRGSKTLLNVWGADHAGYVKRLATAVGALTENKAEVDVKLCQMVRFMDNGEPLKMSKRAGVFVTLEQAVEKVGADAIRFMMVWRKNDAFLDFDFEKVVEQSKDNPVFYVQYAHARCHSIKKHFIETFGKEGLNNASLADVDLTVIEDDADIAMIKCLAQWPRQVEVAAKAMEPHRIAYYLYALASEFHGLWNKGKTDAELRFIDPENKDFSKIRFALVSAVATVLSSGLKLLGIDPKEEMR